MIHVVIRLLLSIFFSYNLISYYFVLRKANSIFGVKVSKFKYNFLNNYINKLNTQINNLEKPYNLNVIKYLFIKYILSTIFFIITFVRFKNIFISVLFFLCIFFIPNILIYYFKKNEKIYVLKDLLTLSYNLRIAFNVNISLYDALKVSCENLKYKRLKGELDKFNETYKMYNYNIVKASKQILNKFNIEELGTLINILDENQNVENTINLLKSYKEIINFKMYKFLKKYYLGDIYCILILSIMLLITTFVIVIYPISAQIIDSLNIILN